ncbi:MAG: hypothetical protein ABIP89_01640, partial [Polyangiaceae bacterium]
MKICSRLTMAILGCALVLAACDSGDNAATGDAGASDGGARPNPVTDGGFALKPFTRPNVGALGAGQLLLTASGESLALTGYPFPARNAGDPVFADGWQIDFTHLLVTYDKISLSENPDRVPTDQSETDGVIAEADGPWAFDLHEDEPSYLGGKEEGSRAVPFAVLSSQNRNGNAAFATDGTKYAVGFESTTATSDAVNVNLGVEALEAYQEMIRDGCVVLYVGTATFKGDAECAGAGAKDGDGGVLSRLPVSVPFRLCFKSPTSYVNCDNQDNQGAASNGEPHPRGIAFPPNKMVTGEITLHTDHPFWESTQHDTPSHFDQLAARLGPGEASVTMNDLVGLDYTGFVDRAGEAVPWRICDPSYQNP